MTDTSARPEPVRLTDLADPEFSPDARAIIDAVGAMAADVELNGDALMTAAGAQTGLDDFGPMDFVERMDVLLAALDTEAGLSPMGRVSAGGMITGLLVNRLLLTDLLARHPEIHDVEIAAPMVIAGLPRTGTTHLHNLISSDPALRSLPYWESIQPVPFPAEAALVGTDDDPRIARTEMSLGAMDVLMPHFKRMHEMTTWHVHEEIQLLAVDFSTMLFDTMAPMPSWREYYLAHDQTPHYEYMKTRAQGDAVAARRRALDPEVAPAPRAVRAAHLHLPRRHRARHPPRPRVGDGLDVDDGLLLGPHLARPRRPRAHRRLLGRPARDHAQRRHARPPPAARRPVDGHPLRRLHGRRHRHRAPHLRAGRPAADRRARWPPSRPTTTPTSASATAR